MSTPSVLNRFKALADEATSVNTFVTSQQESIKALIADALSVSNHIQSTKAQLLSCQNQVTLYQQQIDSLQKKIDAVKNTTSIKQTAIKKLENALLLITAGQFLPAEYLDLPGATYSLQRNPPPTRDQVLNLISAIHKDISSLNHKLSSLSHQLDALDSKLKKQQDECAEITKHLHSLQAKHSSLEQQITAEKAAVNSSLAKLKADFDNLKPLYFKNSSLGSQIDTALTNAENQDYTSLSFTNTVKKISSDINNHYQQVSDGQHVLDNAFKVLEQANDSMSSNLSNFKNNAPGGYASAYNNWNSLQNKLKNLPQTIKKHESRIDPGTKDVFTITVTVPNPAIPSTQNAVNAAQNTLTSLQNKIWSKAQPAMNGFDAFDQFDQAFQKYQFSLPFCPATTMFTDYYLNTFKPALNSIANKVRSDSEGDFFDNNGSSTPAPYTNLETLATNNWDQSTVYQDAIQLKTYYDDIFTDPSCK